MMQQHKRSSILFSALICLSFGWVNQVEANDTIEKKDLDNRLQQLINTTKANLVFVQDGEFMMGDFGSEDKRNEFIPYDSNLDSKPLHKVQLSAYSISKYKVTYSDYQLYLLANGLPINPYKEGSYENISWTQVSRPNAPAGINWTDADKYCHWLGKISHLPFSLPTEAQWEYAARNRGQYVIFPTDTGLAEPDKNLPSFEARDEYAQSVDSPYGFSGPMDVGLYPPNSLGLYDMAYNGYEWMKDWYRSDYYTNSPVKDPQGPETPEETELGKTKVVRSRSYDNSEPAMSMNRFRMLPERAEAIYSARCVVNSPEPVK